LKNCGILVKKNVWEFGGLLSGVSDCQAVAASNTEAKREINISLVVSMETSSGPGRQGVAAWFTFQHNNPLTHNHLLLLSSSSLLSLILCKEVE
jgi:hypothetical protein